MDKIQDMNLCNLEMQSEHISMHCSTSAKTEHCYVMFGLIKPKCRQKQRHKGEVENF